MPWFDHQKNTRTKKQKKGWIENLPLPETNIFAPKNGGNSNRNFRDSRGLFSGVMLVSESVTSSSVWNSSLMEILPRLSGHTTNHHTFFFTPKKPYGFSNKQNASHPGEECYKTQLLRPRPLHTNHLSKPPTVDCSRSTMGGWTYYIPKKKETSKDLS